MPADYHSHTPLCHHAVGEPAAYAAHALEVGLDEMGFSDHSPMPRDDFDDWRMAQADLDRYVESVRHAQQDYPDLSIKLAMEVDYLPGHEAWIRELAGRHSWDYLIGSVHYISESWDIDNPKRLSEWRTRNAGDVWQAYADRLTQAADSGLFDIIGHADLCKKFCFFPEGDLSHYFEPFLRAARRTNTAIELNTAGLRKECKEIYPSPAILAMAQREGVAITFGSDAHAPEEIGLNFAEAVDLARSAGYTHYRRFSRRQKHTVALE